MIAGIAKGDGGAIVAMTFACDSYDITDGSEAWQELSLRVIHDQELPGESLEEEDQSTKKPEPTAVLFYS
jgi:hypothetical protein